MYDLIISGVRTMDGVVCFHRMYTRVSPTDVDSLMDYTSDLDTPIMITILDVTNYTIEVQDPLRLLMITDQGTHSTHIVFDSNITNQEVYYRSTIISLDHYKNVRIVFLR